MEALRQQRLVSLHRAVERLTEQVRSFFHSRRERDEPFRADERQLSVRIWLVEQQRRTFRIRRGTDERGIEEMNAHASRFVGHTARVPGLGIMDASERREVAVTN